MKALREELKDGQGEKTVGQSVLYQFCIIIILDISISKTSTKKAFAKFKVAFILISTVSLNINLY